MNMNLTYLISNAMATRSCQTSLDPDGLDSLVVSAAFALVWFALLCAPDSLWGWAVVAVPVVFLLKFLFDDRGGDREQLQIVTDSEQCSGAVSESLPQAPRGAHVCNTYMRRGGGGGAGVDVGAWEVAGVIVGVGESVEGLACKRAFI